MIEEICHLIVVAGKPHTPQAGQTGSCLCHNVLGCAQQLHWLVAPLVVDVGNNWLIVQPDQPKLALQVRSEVLESQMDGL